MAGAPSSHSSAVAGLQTKWRQAMPRFVERFGKIRPGGEDVVEARGRLLATLPVVQRGPRRPPMRGIGSPGGFDHLAKSGGEP